jgi:hypothetical protein
MKRKLLLLNLALIISLLLLIQQFHSRRNQFNQTHDLRLLTAKPDPSPLSPKPGVKTGASPNFFPIVTNLILTPDRTDIIPPEPPPAAPPKKVLPPKPILSGIFRLGGEEFVLMVSNDPQQRGAQKRLKQGESFDNYVLVSILDQRVKMKYEEEEVEIRLNEPSGLVARESGASTHGATAAAGGRITSIGETTLSQGSARAQAVNPVSAPVQPTEVPPPPGKRKVIRQTPFGPMESYEDIR